MTTPGGLMAIYGAGRLDRFFSAVPRRENMTPESPLADFNTEYSTAFWGRVLFEMPLTISGAIMRQMTTPDAPMATNNAGQSATFG